MPFLFSEKHSAVRPNKNATRRLPKAERCEMYNFASLILLILSAFAINAHASNTRGMIWSIRKLAENGASTREIIILCLVLVFFLVVSIVYKFIKTPWSYTSKYLKNCKNLERVDSPKLINGKEYNEHGILIREVQLPEKYKEYYVNGKIKLEAIGLIVKENGIFYVQEGTITEFDVKGNILYSAIYKDFKRVN